MSISTCEYMSREMFAGNVPGNVAGAQALMPRGKFDRSARKAQTRSWLLEAAARVYARCGFAGATLEEVASDAGFTKGAVYAHFGSKENLLLALVEEHLAGQVAEQLELFDRERVTWERPLAGSEHWMESLGGSPTASACSSSCGPKPSATSRCAARSPRRCAAARHLRRLRRHSAADAGLEPPAHAAEQFANVMLALGLGLGMLELTDPDAVSPTLLGATISVLDPRDGDQPRGARAGRRLGRRRGRAWQSSSQQVVSRGNLRAATAGRSPGTFSPSTSGASTRLASSPRQPRLAKPGPWLSAASPGM